MVKHELGSGTKAPDEVYVLVEVPKGSQNKYEYNHDLGVIMLDRVLHSPVHYPADYGHIPGTHCEDGDPLDVLVLVTEPTFPGCVICARPIAVMEMEDEKGLDDKILAVPIDDPRFDQIRDMADVAPHILREIAHFFEIYKALEPNKWTKVRKWYDAAEARKRVQEAINLYNSMAKKLGER
jgi:inorganic pyrophosphatase